VDDGGAELGLDVVADKRPSSKTSVLQ
jgi:hypothetical protein